MSEVALLEAVVVSQGVVHILDSRQQSAPNDYMTVNTAVCSCRVSKVND